MRTKMRTVLMLLCFPVLLGAQQQVLNVDRNLPRAGDELIKEQVVWVEAGEAGENQIWDFSRVVKVNDGYTLSYFGNETRQLTGKENESLYYYFLSKDSLLCTGFENSMTLIKYNEPQLLLHFPLSYGSSTRKNYSGRGKFCDRLELMYDGEISTRTDGSGRLILNEGDTLNNVLRVHIRIRSLQQAAPITSGFDINATADNKTARFAVENRINRDTTWIFEDIYRWYADGYRYPVFETVGIRKEQGDTLTIEQRSAFRFHPDEQKRYLAVDNENALSRDINRMQFQMTYLPELKPQFLYKIYPNPVRDRLQITINPKQNEIVVISLYDMHGRLLRQLSGKKSSGDYTETVDMSDLVKGNYVLQIRSGSNTVNEKIVKQ